MLPENFSPGLCGHAGGLGLAVEPKMWKKIEFENERGIEIDLNS